MTPDSTPPSVSRRDWLALVARGGAAAVALALVGRDASAVAIAGGSASPLPPSPADTAAPPTPILVHKDASCRCCEKWVAHMRANGFRPTVRDEANMDAVKQTLGVPAAVASCHTAVVGGYIVEGHVPAADVRRMLATRPKIVGLALPGMVTGSPGMEIPGRPADRYEVLTFDAAGRTRRFASH